MANIHRFPQNLSTLCRWSQTTACPSFSGLVNVQSRFNGSSSGFHCDTEGQRHTLQEQTTFHEIWIPISYAKHCSIIIYCQITSNIVDCRVMYRNIAGLQEHLHLQVVYLKPVYLHCEWWKGNDSLLSKSRSEYYFELGAAG